MGECIILVDDSYSAWFNLTNKQRQLTRDRCPGHRWLRADLFSVHAIMY